MFDLATATGYTAWLNDTAAQLADVYTLGLAHSSVRVSYEQNLRNEAELNNISTERLRKLHALPPRKRARYGRLSAVGSRAKAVRLARQLVTTSLYQDLVAKVEQTQRTALRSHPDWVFDLQEAITEAYTNRGVNSELLPRTGTRTLTDTPVSDKVLDGLDDHAELLRSFVAVLPQCNRYNLFDAILGYIKQEQVWETILNRPVADVLAETSDEDATEDELNRLRAAVDIVPAALAILPPRLRVVFYGMSPGAENRQPKELLAVWTGHLLQMVSGQQAEKVPNEPTADTSTSSKRASEDAAFEAAKAAELAEEWKISHGTVRPRGTFSYRNLAYRTYGV